ncbi:hypothetical protein [Roseicitreum antarcticum]|uniref:Uncharacterized protein n=1 Tax=Roseicitreum antarcticum TaxID=564137 RepID=A0A1H3G5J3_9RHOB|nr:hypothetical protein [Roseicitreum antarcticum]SDX98307.1 hypothetical protein SAMN04488238_1652 [Roseicitreum antarcticum]
MARDRRSHVRKQEALSAAPVPVDASSNLPLAKNRSAPHPCLVEIVRLLARQTAKADVAAQRANDSED